MTTLFQCVKKLPETGNEPRRVSPPQRRNKIKIAISGDMRIGNRTLHPKRFESFSKKNESLLGCTPRCQQSNAFLIVWDDRDTHPGHPFLSRLCLYRHQPVGLERAMMKRR